MTSLLRFQFSFSFLLFGVDFSFSYVIINIDKKRKEIKSLQFKKKLKKVLTSNLKNAILYIVKKEKAYLDTSF